MFLRARDEARWRRGNEFVQIDPQALGWRKADEILRGDEQRGVLVVVGQHLAQVGERAPQVLSGAVRRQIRPQQFSQGFTAKRLIRVGGQIGQQRLHLPIEAWYWFATQFDPERAEQ